MSHIAIYRVLCSVCLALKAVAVAQDLASDPGVLGPPLELVHVYNDAYPAGIAVSRDGRMFSNYPRSIDPNTTEYTVAELTSNSTEAPYPSVQINLPPGGPFNLTTTPVTGSNYQDYLISVSTVVLDAKDRLWLLDSGRSLTSEAKLVTSNYGGPKLVGIDINTDSVFQTIIFPPDVVYSDSYMNDIRFDLTPALTPSGGGVAYISDSSNEGRNGIITVDLGSGKSWRHLENHPSVRPEPGFIRYIWGEAVYVNLGDGRSISGELTGIDGIALSADGSRLFWTPNGSRTLYSILTESLRANEPTSDLLATAAVVSHGQKGSSDGLDSDSNSIIYGGAFESNGIFAFNPANGTTQLYVRDPRLSFTDALHVGPDGYLYFTNNQLWRGPSYTGVEADRRVKPYPLHRVPCPNDGTKIQLI
ncbi:MAG: hypothetical protein M1833_000426 [Piccolia ochrophora]|nr:MAG: hypothetical protein M1833_000426 [Piccolia ochrophora]